MIHYSNQAGPARRAGIRGHEERFRAYKDSVLQADLIAAAEVACQAARVPPSLREETLSGIAKSAVTLSRQELAFNYKLAFESIREQPNSAPFTGLPR